MSLRSLSPLRPACLAALVALPFFCGSALAQGAFHCGGVGVGDQQRMKAEASNHDALLTFAVSTGAYLSDVDVRITDGKGAVVVEGRCDGPLMLVDLPGKGTYQVTANSEGRAQKKTLQVAGKGTRATFTWPAAGS